MNVAFSVPLSLLIIGVCSALLFIAVTVVCHIQGMFDSDDSLGVGVMFALVFYLLFWLAPSLTAWAVWATWWQK